PAEMRRNDIPSPSSKAKPLLLMLICDHPPPYLTPLFPHLLPSGNRSDSKIACSVGEVPTFITTTAIVELG
ncbi:MAG: hypothetical protein PHH05_09235, partial [Syntrophaceticus sp.]|nr:hypothetical protein [Syntrophaceticus sp.]